MHVTRHTVPVSHGVAVVLPEHALQPFAPAADGSDKVHQGTLGQRGEARKRPMRTHIVRPRRNTRIAAGNAAPRAPLKTGRRPDQAHRMRLWHDGVARPHGRQDRPLGHQVTSAERYVHLHVRDCQPLAVVHRHGQLSRASGARGNDAVGQLLRGSVHRWLAAAHTPYANLEHVHLSHLHGRFLKSACQELLESAQDDGETPPCA